MNTEELSNKISSIFLDAKSKVTSIASFVELQLLEQNFIKELDLKNYCVKDPQVVADVTPSRNLRLDNQKFTINKNTVSRPPRPASSSKSGKSGYKVDFDGVFKVPNKQYVILSAIKTLSHYASVDDLVLKIKTESKSNVKSNLCIIYANLNISSFEQLKDLVNSGDFKFKLKESI